jgi:hypothetical protein
MSWLHSAERSIALFVEYLHNTSFSSSFFLLFSLKVDNTLIGELPFSLPTLSEFDCFRCFVHPDKSSYSCSSAVCTKVDGSPSSDTETISVTSGVKPNAEAATEEKLKEEEKEDAKEGEKVRGPEESEESEQKKKKKKLRKRVSFAVLPHERVFDSPALSLFAPEQQQRGAVFRTKRPLLSRPECRRVLDIVHNYHEEQCGGVWGTVRHSSVKTTDVAVENVPGLQQWLLALLHTRLYPLIGVAFPVLADGTGMYESWEPFAAGDTDVASAGATTQREGETATVSPRSQSQKQGQEQGQEPVPVPVPKPVSKRCRIRVHDAFIVRYDADRDLSCSLPEHCDTSCVSVVLSLSSEAGGDYEGGGTWFEALGEQG